jgi:hypothetical protein
MISQSLCRKSDFMPGRHGGRPYANHSDPWRFEGSRVGSGSVPTGSKGGIRETYPGRGFIPVPAFTSPGIAGDGTSGLTLI